MRISMVVLICLLLVIPCTAEVIVVDPNGCADFDNIQDAINASIDGDTILVTQWHYYENIDFRGKAIILTSVEPNDPNVVENTIIDANGDGIVVSFHLDEGPNSVITGFTITGGHAEYGAGICCWGESSPTISHCFIKANYADDIPGSKGAGIYYVGSSSISGCTISDNSADESGGGIYCEGASVTIFDCNISNNSGYDGGGIYCESSNTDISNCSINNNLAGEEGGGIYCIYGDLTISNCHIIGNSAGGGGGGGGIKCRYGILAISNCIVNGNSADDSNGGGIHCSESGSPTVSHCTISDNSAHSGGGIYGSATISDCNVSNNRAYRSGGAVYCEGGSPTISNCIISSNSAGNGGGGIICDGCRDTTVGDCTIIGNSATGDGGGIYCLGGNSTNIVNCVILNNSTYDKGGGVCLEGSEPTIESCIVNGNSATNNGGGICYYGGGNPSYILYVTINKCVISSNSSEGNGGGISCYRITNPTCIFPIMVSNCTISGNQAIGDGGGIYSEGGISLAATNCDISGNLATSEGGGICCYDGYNPVINNCTISSNSANEEGGGIYCYNNSSLTIITNNIICNSTSGSGIYSIYSDSILSYNNVYGNAGGDYEGWAWPGEGDISVDPCFAALGYWSDPCGTPADTTDDVWVGGDYHLQSGAGRWDPSQNEWIYDVNTSQCIDAGDPNSDWTAELWPHGKRINMGAYGGTPEASMSLLKWGNIADLNTDNFVGYRDMILFTSKWPFEKVLLAEDLNRDGFVNFIDFAIFAENWNLSRRASNPNPTNGIIDVSLTADLMWTAGIDATSHDVYFGTSDPPPFIDNQIAATFDPGTMAPSATYYWRIDELNPWETTAGTVWNFTTMALSLEASDPNPANDARDVSLTTDLSWTAGPYATSHDVYFGTSNPPPFIRNQTATIFEPGTMAQSTTYYWRIDEVNPWETTTGTVWSFTTIPLEATNPNPPDGAQYVSLTADLNWTTGAHATSHDVYFGTSSPPPFIGNQTSTIFDAGIMAPITTYYWRIDEVNPWETTTGTVWSFTLI